MSLVDRVVAAKKQAEEANAMTGARPWTDQQEAAILIAMVQAIVAADTIKIEPPAEEPTA